MCVIQLMVQKLLDFWEILVVYSSGLNQRVFFSESMTEVLMVEEFTLVLLLLSNCFNSQLHS